MKELVSWMSRGSDLNKGNSKNRGPEWEFEDSGKSTRIWSHKSGKGPNHGKDRAL